MSELLFSKSLTFKGTKNEPKKTMAMAMATKTMEMMMSAKRVLFNSL